MAKGSDYVYLAIFKTLSGALYLFKDKVPKAKKKDFKSNRSTPLVNIFIISSLLKCKAKKAFKKFLRNKLKIKAIKPLAFNKAKK